MRTSLAVVWLLALCVLGKPVADGSAGTAPTDSGWQRREVAASPWAHALTYRMLLPGAFDPESAYPTLVLLPPGKQDDGMVDAAIDAYVKDEPAKRGWVVVVARAPEGVAWGEVAVAEFERMLLDVASAVRVEGGRFHLAGVSSGGRAILRLSLALPDRCASVTVLPGYLDPADYPTTAPGFALRAFVGERDTAWKDRVASTVSAWKSAGGTAELEVISGQEHILKTLSPRRVMEGVEKGRARGAGTAGEREEATKILRHEAEVWKRLDTLHHAAAVADAEAYFGCFSQDGLFFGTDPQERWTIEAFRSQTKRAFESGRGWKYRVERRSVTLGPGEATAWFDEDLTHSKYGRFRGVGVCVREGGGWRIAQYALSVVVPNEDLEAVAKELRR